VANYEKMKLVAGWNRALSAQCETVGDIDTDVRPFIPYLIRTMRNEDGIGISANQVGINKRVFITNVPGDYIRIYINPEIVSTRGGDILTEEGCLSFPDKRLFTQRKRHAVIHAFNLSGEQFLIDTAYNMYTPKTSVLLSVCLQHEMDHMNGIDMREYL
jgi:peptide deformylase